VALLVDGERLTGAPAGPLYERAAQLLARKTWKPERRKTLLLHAEADGGPRALLLVGTGPSRDVSGEDLRRAGRHRRQLRRGAGRAPARLATAGALKLNDDRVQALGEGAVLASYRYSEKPPESTPPGRGARGGRGPRRAQGAVRRAVLGEAANLVRHLGDLPGNRCPPRHLAKTAQAVSRKGKLRCKVHGKDALTRMKMGGILAVNQGSSEEPFLVEMEYSPSASRARPCASWARA
jgi:leucyl aminopeptidase